MIAALARHLRAARQRSVLDTLAVGLPVVLALAALTLRGFEVMGAVVALVIGALVIGWIAIRRIQRFDQAWLIAALDAQAPGLEDSSALLFQPSVDGLAALQRARLEARLAEAAAVDMRPDWSSRWIPWTAGVSALVILTALFWPPASGVVLGPQEAETASAPGAPTVTGAKLRITPPAYTGQRSFEQGGLDARAPEGSRIEWVVNFRPHPDAASLSFPGEAVLPLRRDGGRWLGGRVFERSALYRVEAPGLARQRLHRLELIPDAPPVVRVVTPDSSLTLIMPGQSRWAPVFEVRDDYGVDGAAQLRITVTKGEGENITTTQRIQPLVGQGAARLKRFTAALDLAREGLAPGGDMIVQLVVSDNRSPRRQTVESPSVILRWPTAMGLAEGLDGMAKQVMPVYFRSQRQIIIDAEALIAQRGKLTPDAFLDRSNSLGADQAQLRLRYGQFMGEKAEGESGGGGLDLPTNDAPALPTDDAPATPAKAEAHHDDDDGHDHGGGANLNDMTDVVAKYGHAHDTGDAATLFDPGTRSTLAQALDAMWDSERALRQGKPKDALPHAYKALNLLKTAQQAGRIFLARTPPKLPPVDLSRRLTGKREGIVPGRLPPTARDSADTPAVDVWRALGDRPNAPLPLEALARWVNANKKRLADPLALSAAIDTVRNEPQCQDCRRKLRALLWTALERPPAAVHRRDAADARGRRYLDALR
ncbi:DUF4175 family protein [Caulobacter sp. FWC2]|uniref:DUF4175 family protein n=1 Tax=Caulobacter sp. FWC2 TaxID=69664 RepID=UPI000C161B54|nr:DUF4175 family protein [Caulobacter sp. FWC2]PIB91865.1 hypothetical protein CSW62_09940 [Caulobacter sp. FWC2]